VIPGRFSRRERQLERLRETSGYRILRAPWGWTAYKPGSEDEIQAKTLDELEEKLKPPAGQPPLPGRAP
jgi:hypothetical protein